MEEAHNNGKGLVMVLHQELAEHYCSSINSGKFNSVIKHSCFFWCRRVNLLTETHMLSNLFVNP